MSMKGVMPAVLMMAFLLSVVCIFVISPDVAAEEDDDVPTVFVIEDRDHNPDMRHDVDPIKRTIRIVGEFELVSERMGSQNPGHGAYIDYPGMGDMSPMERDLVKNMANLVGFMGFFEGDVPGYKAVAISFEQRDFDAIGTHDPEFISKAVEYLETDPEYNGASEVLEHITTYNQSNIEYLGREISCADTRASGDNDGEDESEEDLCVIDSESDAEIQVFDCSVPSDSNAFSAVADDFIETSFVDYKL